MALLTFTKEFWTIESVSQDPTTCYIFGDNLMGKGKAGQAIIRGLPNAYGIPTKRMPTMTDGSFFIEGKNSRLEDSRKIIELVDPYIQNIPKFNNYVMSFDFGRGLAKLNDLAPLSYHLILAGIITKIGSM